MRTEKKWRCAQVVTDSIMRLRPLDLFTGPGVPKTMTENKGEVFWSYDWYLTEIDPVGCGVGQAIQLVWSVCGVILIGMCR
jgi:hypothetical protein